MTGRKQKHLIKNTPRMRSNGCGETLGDFTPMAAFFASGMLPINADSFAGLKLQDDDLIQALQFALWQLEGLASWQRDDIFKAIKAVADSMEIKG